MKRVPTPEWLDYDQGTSAEVEGTLADLRRINSWFGGITTSRALVSRAAEATGKSSLSLLEVAAGAGFVPLRIREELRTRGVNLQIVLLDRSASHLNGNNGIVGDALALPFPDNTFDLVSSTLFVHHLSPDQVVSFGKEALRVAKTAVIINDLIRHRLHLMLVYAGLPLYRSRITRHDAPASVLQAYTTSEMRDLLKQTPATRVEITRHYLFRMGAIAWK
ncbi:MAG TPA: methyltransferase domain-containing protein [Terriglobales bacterium]|jgi:ubiquinone/menaquinone biosynthesis C-methylase UbiE